MLLAAATTCVIERRFPAAALWCFVAALLSGVGLMHSYRWTPADTAVSLTPAWPWAIGYLVMGFCFLAARWITEEGEGH
jgi:AGZA family xanthine/uracil permease-like MFS transporter